MRLKLDLTAEELRVLVRALSAHELRLLERATPMQHDSNFDAIMDEAGVALKLRDRVNREAQAAPKRPHHERGPGGL